jgi:hypothetical protein
VKRNKNTKILLKMSSTTFTETKTNQKDGFVEDDKESPIPSQTTETKRKEASPEYVKEKMENVIKSCDEIQIKAFELMKRELETNGFPALEKHISALNVVLDDAMECMTTQNRIPEMLYMHQIILYLHQYDTKVNLTDIKKVSDVDCPPNKISQEFYDFKNKIEKEFEKLSNVNSRAIFTLSALETLTKKKINFQHREEILIEAGKAYGEALISGVEGFVPPI